MAGERRLSLLVLLGEYRFVVGDPRSAQRQARAFRESQGRHGTRDSGHRAVSGSRRRARELARLLGLDTPPVRIECYDISNFQGGESVASLVVAEGGRLKKRDYRRFRMKYTEGPDDVAMMREVLGRRFAQARQEQERLDRDEPIPVKWAALPDLIVLDGGRGQLGAAREVLFEYNQAIPVIALAKEQELIYVPDLSEPHALPRDSQALQLLQRLRDEAHRFANAYHQALRERRIVFSVLDEIPGVGERRKKALIRRFCSVRNVRAATVDEIAAVEGIGRKVAERIHAFLAEHPAPHAVS
jgi:excinuclease ABC subunit C